MRSKRNPRYSYVKRYNRDFWGEVYRDGFKKSWSNHTQSFRIFLKNIKTIDKRIKARLVFKVERRRKRKMFWLKKKTNYRFIKKSRQQFRRRFFYRVDIVKLKPKRKRKTLHGLRLKMRHLFVRFASSMKFSKFQYYLLKSRRSSKLMRRFFELFEGRLDFFLYRMNLIKTSPFGRQLICHKFFRVNDKLSNISGFNIGFFDYVSPNNVEGFFWWFFERLDRMIVSRIIYKKFFFRGKKFKQKRNYGRFKYRKKFSFLYRRFFFSFRKKKFGNISSSTLKKKKYKRYLSIISFKKQYKLKFKKSTKFFPKSLKFFVTGFRKRINLGKNFRDVFFSIPSYIEINFRIMSAIFIEKPKVYNVFYPFKINKWKLPSFSTRFK